MSRNYKSRTPQKKEEETCTVETYFLGEVSISSRGCSTGSGAAF